MDEDPDDPPFEVEDNLGSKKKGGFKPSPMVNMQPCDDLHRYVVDNLHSSTRSKTVLFEKIDLSTYKSSAKVTSFLTSEERLPLWIKTFIMRYYNHLNTTGYRVTWQEQESCTVAQQRVIKLFSTFMMQKMAMKINLSPSLSSFLVERNSLSGAGGSSRDEFPTLLFIVNSLEPLGTPCLNDLSLFLTALPNFFQKCHDIVANTQQLNDATDKEDAVRNNEIRCDRSETPSGDKENTEAL